MKFLIKIAKKRSLVMRLSKNVFGFALLASALSVGSSYAQQIVNFSLPVPVKWGGKTLEPGSYQMQLPSASLGVQSVFMRNAERTVVALPLTTDYSSVMPLARKSYLQLVNVNGIYFVRKYVSSATGRTLVFGIPKVHNDSIAQNTTIIASSN
jgi:hypothetical protein